MELGCFGDSQDWMSCINEQFSCSINFVDVVRLRKYYHTAAGNGGEKEKFIGLSSSIMQAENVVPHLDACASVNETVSRLIVKANSVF